MKVCGVYNINEDTSNLLVGNQYYHTVMKKRSLKRTSRVREEEEDAGEHESCNMQGGPKKRSKLPIRFQLLNVYYMPEDNHSIYLEGRSSNADFGGVCAVTHFQTYFCFERNKPFSSKTEIDDFLERIQTHLGTLHRVNINNQYKADIYKKDVISSNLHFSKAPTYGRTSVSDNMRDFCASWELVEHKHRTGGHYTPKTAYLQVVKVYVRLPYMAKSMHLYFESDEYLDMIRRLGYENEWLVRTFLATADVSLMYCMINNVSRNRWCTIDNYTLLPSAERRVYRKTNIALLNNECITCDKEDIEPAPFRILSCDAEMPGPPGKFPDPECDPVVVISALVFDDASGVKPNLREGRIFVYKHEKAAPCADLNLWITNCQKKLQKAIESGDPHRTQHYKDLMEFWEYGKIKLEEYDDEMSIIYAFEKFLHDSDIDIVTGWNFVPFDIPYFHKRWLKLKEGTTGPHKLRQPNFGALVRQSSHLQSYNPVQGASFGGGGSAKQGRSYDYVSMPHYILNDGLEMWRNDKEEKRHTLNVVAQRFLEYDKAAVAAGVQLAKQCASEMYQRGNMNKENYEREKDSSLQHCSLADLVKSNKQEDNDEDEDDEEIGEKDIRETLLGHKIQLEKLTVSMLDTVSEIFTSPTSTETFPMKKIEFKHSEGRRYHRTGGELMLKFGIYCAIDCLLPVLLIKYKGKIQSQLSFAMVSGVNFEDVYGRGQQMKVDTAIYIYTFKLYDGMFLTPDKGYHHYHWPRVFRHPHGPAKAVMYFWDRLKPFYGGKANEGGKVQKPTGYGVYDDIVFTEDAAAMYPSEMGSNSLCFTAFLTSGLIEEYDVPRYEYVRKPLGSVELNMCGERVQDHEAALLVGCDTDDLKVSYFHQNCETIVPSIVSDFSVIRGNGKVAKAAWLALAKKCVVYIEGGNGTKTFELIEIEYHQSETTDSAYLESYKATNETLQTIFNVAKTTPAHGQTLIKDAQMFAENATLTFFLKRVCTWCVNMPKELEQLSSDSKVVLLKLMLRVLTTIPSEQRTPLNIMRLAENQSSNFESFQLGVKVCMNSLYGVLMRVAGALALPEISTTVTASGRDHITHVLCTTERQTSQNAKDYLGLINSSEKADATLAKKVNKGLNWNQPLKYDCYIPAGKFMRKLPEAFVPKLARSLQSYENINTLYGDTVSYLISTSFRY
jgi:DNA polymerase elongation subunit (family B)